jgi:hypothetical protein
MAHCDVRFGDSRQGQWRLHEGVNFPGNSLRVSPTATTLFTAGLFYIKRKVRT